MCGILFLMLHAVTIFFSKKLLQFYDVYRTTKEQPQRLARLLSDVVIKYVVILMHKDMNYVLVHSARTALQQ